MRTHWPLVLFCSSVAVFFDEEKTPYRLDYGKTEPERAPGLHVPMLLQGCEDLHQMKDVALEEVIERVQLLHLSNEVCFPAACLDGNPSEKLAEICKGILNRCLAAVLADDWGYDDDESTHPELTEEQRETAWRKLAARLAEKGLDAERVLMWGRRTATGEHIPPEEYESIRWAYQKKMGYV